MSAYTDLIRSLLKARYWYSKSTTIALPADSFSPFEVVRIRISTFLHPGSVAHTQQGDPVYQTPAFSSGVAMPPTYFEGVNFGIPTMGYWAGAIDNDEYLDTNKWFNRDYTYEDLRSGGLNGQAVDAIYRAYTLIQELANRLEWIPNSVISKWKQAVLAGGVPYLWNSRVLSQQAGGGAVPWPSWINTPGRQAAWDAVSTLFDPLHKDFNAVGWALYNQEASRIASDVQFWSTVSQWSGVDALMSQWEKLKGLVRDFNAQKRIAEDSLRQCDALIAAAPGAFTPQQKSAPGVLRAELDSLTQQAKATTAPLKPALEQDAVTLGIAPVVLIAVGVAVVAGATTALISYVTVIQNTTRLSNEQLREFTTTRELYDNRMHEQEISSIRAREQELADLYRRGMISLDEYNKGMSTLSARADAANVQLLKSREQTTQAAVALNDALKKTQESGAGDLFSGAKWIAIAGAVGLSAVFVVPRLMRRK
jgi:hypothetical protein